MAAAIVAVTLVAGVSASSGLSAVLAVDASPDAVASRLPSERERMPVLRSAAVTGPGTGMVVVSPGETVWDLALAHAPAGEHPQVYVAEVLARNDVDPARLRPGTVLRLPRP